MREREKAGMEGGKQEDERGMKPTNQLKENKQLGLFERGREKRREEGGRERERAIDCQNRGNRSVTIARPLERCLPAEDMHWLPALTGSQDTL